MIALLCVLLIINVVSGEIITLTAGEESCGVTFTANGNDVYNIKYHYKSLDTSTISGSVYDSITYNDLQGTEFTGQLEIQNEVNGVVEEGTYYMCISNDNMISSSQVDIIEMSVEINGVANTVRHGMQIGAVLLILFVYIGIPVAIIAGITIFIYRRVKQREITIIKKTILTDTPMDNYTNV